jgi:hypothetical protein
VYEMERARETEIDYLSLAPMFHVGQVRRCRVRLLSVRFALHCGRCAAMPRTDKMGQEPTSRPLSRMPATGVVLSKSCRRDRAEVSLSIPATDHFDWTDRTAAAVLTSLAIC